MSVAKVPMTARGFKKLREELIRLKGEERPHVIEAIAAARAQGDLSENAEYHAARERQAFIEARISELESKVSRADVIDISALSNQRVQFGTKVTLIDADTKKEHIYQIVGVDEADVTEGLLSIESPLARGLLGKQVGDSVEIKTPAQMREYEIQAIHVESNQKT